MNHYTLYSRSPRKTFFVGALSLRLRFPQIPFFRDSFIEEYTPEGGVEVALVVISIPNSLLH